MPTRSRLTAVTAVALVTASIAAAAPPPEYEQAKQRLVADGRAIAALVRAGDAEAVVGRFTPTLARDVPLTQVESVLAQDPRRGAHRRANA